MKHASFTIEITQEDLDSLGISCSQEILDEAANLMCEMYNESSFAKELREAIDYARTYV